MVTIQEQHPFGQDHHGRPHHAVFISQVVTIQEQHPFGQDHHGRPHHCSLHFPGGRRCPCSKWLNFLEEFYDSAWRSLRMSEERESRPKEKGTPLRGGGFYLWTRPPSFLLIAGESESGVCSLCDLLRFCQSLIRYHVTRAYS